MRFKLLRFDFLSAMTLATTALCASAATFAADKNSSPIIDCDRKCLYKIADTYMEALVKKDPTRVDWAEQVMFTEMGIPLKIGDGLWNTISAKRDYDLKIADPSRGQVAVFEVVEEHGRPAILAARIKVENKKISEVETVLSRKVDNAPFPQTENLIKPPKILLESIPVEKRTPRARMISIADGYFDTLQLNDGTILTQFHKDCNRIENGLQTTNNPKVLEENPQYTIALMGCEDQFKMGQYIYDDELRARRFPLVDEEKGIVLAGGYIDHAGKIMEVTWTDGKTKTESPFFYPHSYILLEMFKIEDGKIRQVEAVFGNVSYRQPTVWKDRGID